VGLGFELRALYFLARQVLDLSHTCSPTSGICYSDTSLTDTEILIKLVVGAMGRGQVTRAGQITLTCHFSAITRWLELKRQTITSVDEAMDKVTLIH
jgi:hypothetical protein